MAQGPPQCHRDMPSGRYVALQLDKMRDESMFESSGWPPPMLPIFLNMAMECYKSFLYPRAMSDIDREQELMLAHIARLSVLETYADWAGMRLLDFLPKRYCKCGEEVASYLADTDGFYCYGCHSSTKWSHNEGLNYCYLNEEYSEHY